ncbi:MAG: tetratricopeptide repeat protein [Isosphaeraceae bacterium]|nr:tetratricopeptide repeat protein [Isosphaeraceae bacterium]
MPRRHLIALLSIWPGLPQVWSGQEVLGLLLAALFAATLNLAILTRFVWTEAFPPGWPSFFAALAVLTWFASLGYTLWWLWRFHPEQHQAEIDRLYREAIECYLQGRWNDARCRLEQLLALDETDADALMQLGTLYLRTGQYEPARRTYRQCLELEGGAKWRWEIGQALAKLGEG